MPLKNRARKQAADAKAIFQAALSAAHAGNAVRAHLSLSRGILKAGPHRFPLRSFDRIFLIAIGKAAVEMAAAVEDIVGDHLAGGLAITKHGHAQRRRLRIPIVAAGPPIPGNAQGFWSGLNSGTGSEAVPRDRKSVV